MKYSWLKVLRVSESEWVFMSDEFFVFGLWVIGGFITGFTLVALTMWAIAEWDERKWRKRMDEIAREGLDRV